MESEWIAGNPEKPGTYWIFTLKDGVFIADVISTGGGLLFLLVIGSDRCMSGYKITHHMPITPPAPPATG